MKGVAAPALSQVLLEIVLLPGYCGPPLRFSPEFGSRHPWAVRWGLSVGV